MIFVFGTKNASVVGVLNVFFWCVLKFEQGVCVKMFLFYFRIATNNSNATSFQRVVAHISMCANGVHNEWSLKTLVFSNCPLDDI